MNTQRLHVSPASAVTAVAAAGLILLLVHGFLASNTVRTAPVQPVVLMAPPPPPPPTPAPVENIKKAEAEDLRSIKSLDAVDWSAGTPGAGPGEAGPTPTGGALGLDEAGGSGSDAFGLAGKPGGIELLQTGGGGGGNPSGRYLQFASQLESHIAKQLNQIPELRQTCYRVDIQVRVSATGSIEGVKIRKSTGDRALDAAIADALETLPPMSTLPPSDMPWPVGLAVTSRRTDCPEH
jgi:TonB family protein